MGTHRLRERKEPARDANLLGAEMGRKPGLLTHRAVFLSSLRGSALLDSVLHGDSQSWKLKIVN